MKYLAAAESSLAQANRFYLLMYTIAAVIALTAYLEKGSILNDRKQAAENEITFVGLKKLAEPVYSNLRWNLTQLYPDKNVANRFQALLVQRYNCTTTFQPPAKRRIVYTHCRSAGLVAG